MRTVTTRIIAGRVNPDGSIATGSGFTVQKGTVGVYTVTLPPDGRLLGATISPGGTASAIGGVVASVTGRSFVATCYTGASAGADSGFSFVATVAA